MNGCGDIRDQLAFYLDYELSDLDRVLFEEHVRSCHSCSDAITGERSFLELLRSDGRGDSVPRSVRSRVEGVLQTATEAERAPADLRRRVEHLVGVPRSVPAWRRFAVASMAVSLALLALAFAWRTSAPEAVGPSEFAVMSVATHQRHQRGSLPLEIETGSPEAVKNWFGDKVPFLLELPTYQEVSGQDRLYGIVGARLVAYRGDYAAFVAYEMSTRPISLIVTSTTLAPPSGGQIVVARGLTFHFDVVDGLRVITWSHRGLTYALVSDLEERGEDSCKVCHAGAPEQDFLVELRVDRITGFSGLQEP